MAYFRNRGFRDDIIEKFQLGYCTESHDAFAKEAIQKGYKKEYLVKPDFATKRMTTDCGIVFGDVWFSLSIRFPVKWWLLADVYLPVQRKGVKVKYVNSPESEIYHKSNELYGIYFAKQAIVKQDRCFLVEGYTDVSPCINPV